MRSPPTHLLFALLVLGGLLLVLALLGLLSRVHDVGAELVRHVHHFLGAARVALMEDGTVFDLVLCRVETNESAQRE